MVYPTQSEELVFPQLPQREKSDPTEGKFENVIKDTIQQVESSIGLVEKKTEVFFSHRVSCLSTNISLKSLVNSGDFSSIEDDFSSMVKGVNGGIKIGLALLFAFESCGAMLKNEIIIDPSRNPMNLKFHKVKEKLVVIHADGEDPSKAIEDLMTGENVPPELQGIDKKNIQHMPKSEANEALNLAKGLVDCLQKAVARQTGKKETKHNFKFFVARDKEIPSLVIVADVVKIATVIFGFNILKNLENQQKELENDIKKEREVAERERSEDEEIKEKKHRTSVKDILLRAILDFGLEQSFVFLKETGRKKNC